MKKYGKRNFIVINFYDCMKTLPFSHEPDFLNNLNENIDNKIFICAHRYLVWRNRLIESCFETDNFKKYQIIFSFSKIQKK